MNYRIELTLTAHRELKALSDDRYARIVQAISGLKGEPRPPGVRKLKGALSGWRIRVGTFRVLYEVDDARKIVTIFRVTDRKKAYL